MNVGCCYDLGMGVKKDSKKAAHWYEKAVNNGNIVAMYNLGLKGGNGVRKDHKKAFELFKKSAEEGNSGINKLGNCHYFGIGTSIDKQKAIKSYQKAANLEKPLAQYNPALMYENGDGIIRNINMAISWYQKSAEQRYKKAQSRMEILLKKYR